MRLGAASDLHFPESGVDLQALAAAAAAARLDAFILVGDAVSSYHPPRLLAVLGALRSAAPVCAYVPGNHELWTRVGSTAMVCATKLPDLARRAGWLYLEEGPAVVGDVALVGNMGWYDYSLLDRETFPAARIAAARDLLAVAAGRRPRTIPLAELDDATLAHKSLAVMPGPGHPDERPTVIRWNDGRFVRFGRHDAEVAAERAQVLSQHLIQAGRLAAKVVVATHMAPFADALPPSKDAVEAVSKAYLGSARLGQAILGCPAVRLVIHGHRHRPGHATAHGLPVVNATARPDRGGALVVREV